MSQTFKILLLAGCLVLASLTAVAQAQSTAPPVPPGPTVTPPAVPSVAAPAPKPALTPAAATAKECGACHMVFPSNLLPARSWTALLGGLSDHFGETATLDPAVTKDILAYLTANAADAAKGNPRALRGLKPGDTPLRITETPEWIRKHNSREVPPARFASAQVKSKANCGACHGQAARGVFGDD